MSPRRAAAISMLLRFTKAEPGVRADALTCVIEANRAITMALPRQGVLPREAIRYVVETTLGWADGWLAELADNAARKRASRRAVQSDVVAECLQSEQWGGATAPEVFIAKVNAACTKRRIEPPALTAEQVARLRTKVREFGAAWRPLPPGGVLEFEV